MAPPWAAAQQVAREELGVRITAVDASAFPTVRVRVLTTGPDSAPVVDLSRLLLRENGVPIPEATITSAAAGVDLALVVDANVDFHVADEIGGPSRRDKVTTSIARFGAENMNRNGLDRVSVIAPDTARLEPLFLVEDATTAEALTSAVAAFDFAPPVEQPLRPTPLQAMLTAALDHLAARADDGRFRAVLLYTDASRIDRQLDAPSLATAAQEAGVPIFVAILGAEASPEELANAQALSEPTNGRTDHMPQPEAADALYALFAAQGSQVEMVYRSPARADGTQQVAVNLGNVRDTAAFELRLAAPSVTLDAPSPIRRAGSAVDTPLALLQPAALALSAVVTWPDDQSRRLTDVVFLVDGTPQPQATAPTPDASGRIDLVWDISERDAGVYELTVAVVDELDFRAVSAPVAVTIETARPSPATPTAAPTIAPPPPPAEGRSWIGPVALLAVAAGVGLLAGMARRARRARPMTDSLPVAPAPRPAPRAGDVAVLEAVASGEQIELLAANVTLGRDPDAVDIVLDDPGISRLHARIRRDDDGQCWLYDEGSAGGTFLNHAQLGLAPQPLQHGDVVQLGRVMLRFRLEPAAAGKTPGNGISPEDKAEEE